MTRVLLSLAVMAGCTLASDVAAQDVDYADHFRVYTGTGEPASLDDIAAAMASSDAVMVGEIHTDPVGHWIEADLFRRALDEFDVGRASGAKRPVALSLEMFERDVQEVVDEYLHGLITEKQFRDASRPWEYYTQDYRPMVEAAKAAGVRVIAANAPRRYVNRVARMGPKALYDLPARARAFLPPLPVPPPSDAYRAEWTALMRDMPMVQVCEEPGGADEDKPAGETHKAPDQAPPTHEPPPQGAPGAPTHDTGRYLDMALQAQNLWDASMAYAITTYLATHPGALVLHMVGGFHVQNFTGIPEKVEFYRPGTRSLVVSMDTADDFRSFDADEYAGRGDFVILTDKSLDLNYARNCAPKKK